MGVDVVADLLASVTEDLVFASFKVAFHEVTEKAVELDAAVVRAGEASSAEAAGGESEVAAILLHHDIGGDFGRAEEGVLGLIDGEILGDAVLVGGIVVVPAGFKLFESDGVGPVAVNLVGRQVDKGRLGTGLPGRFEEVEGADGVGVEVVEGNRGGAVVGRLGGGVDSGVGPQVGEERDDSGAVASVEFVMVKGGSESGGEAPLIPSCVPLRPEKDSPLIVIDAMDFPTESSEVDANFRADEAGGAGDEKFHFRVAAPRLF